MADGDDTRWTMIQRAAEGVAPAREEFAAALKEVVGEHHSATRAEVDAECVRLAEHLR